jgi:hypothetical protein
VKKGIFNVWQNLLKLDDALVLRRSIMAGSIIFTKACALTDIQAVHEHQAMMSIPYCLLTNANKSRSGGESCHLKSLGARKYRWASAPTPNVLNKGLITQTVIN